MPILPSLRSSGTLPPDQFAIGNRQSAIDNRPRPSYLSAPMQPKALPGFGTFIQPTSPSGPTLFNTWRAVAARYGFEEWDGPPLEPLELYTAKSGAEIVGQLYNFVDKGERRSRLRPEMTPTLARVVAARANGLRKPIRWYSIPQLFRYERQQRGRLREHFQLNLRPDRRARAPRRCGNHRAGH